MDFKNYNSQRNKLLLPEYGRHIQEMVSQLLSIEDRETRTIQAQSVIAVMGNLNNNLRDTPDFKHKLWDHLFIMSDFKLDVDSPYVIPNREDLTPIPQRINYPQGNLNHKQYGRNIRNVIGLLKNIDDPVLRDSLAQSAARYMKLKSFEFNQEYPSDEVVLEDLRKFSQVDISLDENSLNSTKINYRNNKQKQNSKAATFKKKEQFTQKSTNFGKKSSYSQQQQTRNNKSFKRTK